MMNVNSLELIILTIKNWMGIMMIIKTKYKRFYDSSYLFMFIIIINIIFFKLIFKIMNL